MLLPLLLSLFEQFYGDKSQLTSVHLIYKINSRLQYELCSWQVSVIGCWLFLKSGASSTV